MSPLRTTPTQDQIAQGETRGKMLPKRSPQLASKSHRVYRLTDYKFNGHDVSINAYPDGKIQVLIDDSPATAGVFSDWETVNEFVHRNTR